MSNVGIMASAVNLGAASVDVLMEPFNNLTNWAVTGTPTIVAGRTGNCVQMINSNAARLDYTVPVANRSDTITMGFALNVNSATSRRGIVETWSDALVTRHMGLYRLQDGTIELSLAGSTNRGSAAGAMPNTGQWYYIEWQTRIHQTAGYGIVRVNGVEVINVTGIDTWTDSGTNPLIETVRLPQAGATCTNLFDDLYITMGAGAFKGSITIP